MYKDILVPLDVNDPECPSSEHLAQLAA